MEGYFESGNPATPYLSLSNSDASSLTAENCKDGFRRSANVTSDCTAWTNEKHNFYLHRLEVSFVEQLYQLKSSLSQCSAQNQSEINISKKQMVHADIDSKQNGCWQNINCERGELLPSSTSADSCGPLKCERNNLKHIGMHCHPSSAKMPTFHRKGMICSHKFSSSNPYNEDLNDLIREETGQNFADEANQSTSNFESQAKRSKTTLEDGLHHDKEISYNKNSPQ